MGRNIQKSEFSSDDFLEFNQRLKEEYRLLNQWFKERYFDEDEPVCGFELEAWLIDQNFLPSPSNDQFLNKLNHSLVVPELSKFNFEINSTPQRIEGSVFQNLAKEFGEIWEQCERSAQEINSKVLTVGILPTLRENMLSLENMSSNNRYQALNDQVLKLRNGQPLQLNIKGQDHLQVSHQDVMLEAAATSLQIHLQVNPKKAIHYYNVSQIISAPMVALMANSPYLFGKDLWQETRIPTFEQAVCVASFRDCRGQQIERVTFGTGYARNSILEPFLENLDGFPVLLPFIYDEDPINLSHLRLHNGTIWRWTRPLIGFDKNGKPHIRIEHRVPAAGPSQVDIIANIAFFVGLMVHFSDQEIPLASQILFPDARKNFYEAARKGFKAQVKWVYGQKIMMKDLLLDILLPAAKKGLLSMGIDEKEVIYYLDEIIKPCVKTERNGANWQREFISVYGPDFPNMTQAYYSNQKLNISVCDWDI